MRTTIRVSHMLAAAAIALAGSAASAHFPQGIADGPRRVTRTKRRHAKPKPKLYEPNRADIAAWNKQVEREKAEKRAPKPQNPCANT